MRLSGEWWGRSSYLALPSARSTLAARVPFDHDT
jgi:hypothetical protein